MPIVVCGRARGAERPAVSYSMCMDLCATLTMMVVPVPCPCVPDPPSLDGARRMVLFLLQTLSRFLLRRVRRLRRMLPVCRFRPLTSLVSELGIPHAACRMPRAPYHVSDTIVEGRYYCCVRYRSHVSNPNPCPQPISQCLGPVLFVSYTTLCVSHSVEQAVKTTGGACRMWPSMMIIARPLRASICSVAAVTPSPAPALDRRMNTIDGCK